MSIRKIAAAAFLLAALSSMPALADSSQIPYQGVLRNTDGTPIADGNYAMAFSIWDAAAAGNQLWTESHAFVAAKDGAFAVQLGETTALGTLFADHSALWLEIEVTTGTGPEVYDPRLPLSSVPYAKQAEKAVSAASATNAVNADTVDGVHAAGLALVGHKHAGENITSGTISTDRYSAYADLAADGKIGTGAAQVAAGNHNHAGRPFFIGQVGLEKSGTKTLSTMQVSGISNTGTTLVAPVAGRYLVHYQQLTRVDTGHSTYLSLRHNGGILCYGWLGSGYMQDMIVERIVTMNAGDSISFTIDTDVQAESWGGVHSSVTMFLIG
jgi:hypothetical protein